jgi:MFS family permease
MAASQSTGQTDRGQRVAIAVAALAMVATLPGRTHGLGLFTEPILRTFQLDRETYGAMNSWATLLGALFCVPCGWLIDRTGVRAVVVGTMLLLAAAVVGLATWTGGTVGVFLFIWLTRGFGQSALSVASLTLVGRSAGPRNGVAMGAYSCLTSIGFVVVFGVLMEVIKQRPDDWRGPWLGIGLGVLAAASIAFFVIDDRSLTRESHSLIAEPSRSLPEALWSPAFWVFALGTSFFGLITAGTSLFNESLLAERGFSKNVFLRVTVIGIPIGLAANMIGGWLATRTPLNRLFAVALAVLAGALAWFPRIALEWQAYFYAACLAASGGVITVCFFTVWRRLYGPAALGRIQGAAQALTVLFSAVGPLIFASAKIRWGEYAVMFPAFAGIAFALGVAAWLVHVSPLQEEPPR